MRLARAIIAKFFQKVKDTLNQERISPSNHASKNRLAVTRTTAIKRTPKAVVVFIDQTASAPLGISTTSGNLESSN
jgi:hypothetical protein